jgi:uncharacterized membrane protein
MKGNKSRNIIISIILIFVSFILLDLVYFYFVQSSMQKMITSIQKSPMTINWVYFITCYLFLTFAVYYFIIRENKSILYAFLLGITVYGVYECTNASLFQKWQNWVVFVDTIWGGILFALVTMIYNYVI